MQKGAIPKTPILNTLFLTLGRTYARIGVPAFHIYARGPIDQKEGTLRRMIKLSRKIVILLSVLVLVSTLGCAVVKVTRKGADPTPTRLVAQPPVAVLEPTQAPPSATPTSTQTPAPTATPAPTDTPRPTNTPKAIEKPTDTPPPAATNTPKPKAPAAPEPTDTPEPAPTEPPAPFTNSKGLQGTVEIVNLEPEYVNGAALQVKWRIVNTSPVDVLFGILGFDLPLAGPKGGFAETRSGPYEKIPAGGEISAQNELHPYRIGQVRGPVTIRFTICYDKLEACKQPGANWEDVSAPFTVNIVPFLSEPPAEEG